jgi:Gylcosyl hydrolase family 115 C-terminal domain
MDCKRWRLELNRGKWDSFVNQVLPISKVSVPSDFSGFVESNGAVSIEASHFSTAEKSNGISYVEIPSYGRILSTVKPWPVTMEAQDPESGRPSTQVLNLHNHKLEHGHPDCQPRSITQSQSNSLAQVRLLSRRQRSCGGTACTC